MKVFTKKLWIGLSLLGIILSIYLIVTSHKPKEETFQLPKTENKATSTTEKDSNNNLLYGGIAIPSIDRVLKIYDYNEEQEPYLTNGSMMDVPNRQMGKDNVVLASHDYDETFGQLIHVKKGDMIYTTDEHSIYTFVVTDTFQVTDDNPQDIKRVREEKETPIITLYTCFGGIGTNQRTVVQAAFKDVTTIDNSKEAVRELFSQKN